jgi:hypothetical protein
VVRTGAPGGSVIREAEPLVVMVPSHAVLIADIG